MGSLLLDSLDKTGIAYRAVSGTRAYKEGLFNEQIDKILRNATKVGLIIKETLGQEKYTETLPYFPICKNCGRIYTTKALEYIPERHVRSEEHTSELQSRFDLVCRLLLEKKKKKKNE